MIVWLNVDGSVGEIVSSYALQDGSGEVVASSFSPRFGNEGGADEIYAYFEGGSPSGGIAYISYRMPSGEIYGNAAVAAAGKESLSIKLDKSRDMRLFKAEKPYEFQRFPFPSGLISTGGAGLYSAGVTDSADGKTYSFGPILFQAKDNAVVRETAITSSEYAQLIAQLQGKLDKIAGATDEALAYAKLADGSQSSIQASEKALPNAIAVRDSDGGLALPGGEKAIGANEGDARYLVKGAGAGAQVVSNEVDFFAGVVAKASEKGASRLLVLPTVTKIISENQASAVGAANAGVTVNGNFAVRAEGNIASFWTNGAKTIVSDPTGASRITASETGLEAKGKLFLESDPTEGKEAATKDYVDLAVATGGDLRLNIANGTGEGSLVGAGASGASGANSVALGKGSSSSVDHGFAIGRNVKLSGLSSGSVAVGFDYESSGLAVFSVGENGKELFSVSNTSTFFTLPVSMRSDLRVSGNLRVSGTLTAANFTAISATSLSTDEQTIGLAKGNQTELSGYAGLYVRKYDGTNDGALVWDGKGTAYVGDCKVDDGGKVTDAFQLLQPILTRSGTDYIADQSVLGWDSKNLRAVQSDVVKVSAANKYVAVSAPTSEERKASLTVWDKSIELNSPTQLGVVKLSEEGVLTYNKKEVATKDGATAVVIRSW